MPGATEKKRLPPRPCQTRLKAQVMVSMTAEERAHLEAIAAQEMRSLSATTRMLLLSGLNQYIADTAGREA